MKLISVSNATATVDDEDYELVIQIGPWSLVEWNRNKYAKRKERLSTDPYPAYATLSMHEVITGWSYVDHIDGNGLNNQRSNLRQTTHAQNIQNQRTQSRSRSGYRGVTYFPMSGKWLRKKPWRVRIKIDGEDQTIGYYADKHEAAEVWNKIARTAWGEYAFQNVIKREEVGL